MRLWSLHPRYLDRMGLLGLWREALLAKKLVYGQLHAVSDVGKKYLNHSHLRRFDREHAVPFRIMHYLREVYREGIRRGYKFNRELTLWHGDWDGGLADGGIKVTVDQLKFELLLLKERVYTRDRAWFDEQLHNLVELIPEPNPVFRLIWGPREEWDKGRLKLEQLDCIEKVVVV